MRSYRNRMARVALLSLLLGGASRCSSSTPTFDGSDTGTGACVPSCREGYVCVSGQCVSACNPSCPVDQQCVDGACVVATTDGGNADAPPIYACDGGVCAVGEICSSGECVADPDWSPGPDPSLQSQEETISDGSGGSTAKEAWGTVVGTFCGVNAYSNANAAATKCAYSNARTDGVNAGKYGYEYQCVEYAFRFLCTVYDAQLGCKDSGKAGASYGNAYAWYDNLKNNPVLSTTKLARFPSGKTTVPPQRGDVLVFGTACYPGTGHVAVVSDVGVDSVTVIEQNFDCSDQDGKHVIKLNRAVDGTYAIKCATGWMRVIGGAPACACASTCTPGSKQCAVNTPQTCSLQADGCYNWTSEATCGSNTTCQSGTCVASGCALPWGGTIAAGGSVAAYQQASVPCGSPCAFETRTCNSGVLSGSYSNSSCSVATCPSGCSLPWGGTIANGASVSAYQSSSVSCGGSCASETRTCNSGVLSGSYSNSSCSVQPCSSCSLPWGGAIANGASVSAYASPAVACGSGCTSQTRTCSNGTLSGSYTNGSCSVQPCSSCITPWGTTVASGASVTAYQSSSAGCGTSCSSQTRTCNNGVLSGTYTNSTCSVKTCGANQTCSSGTCVTRSCGGGTGYYCGDASYNQSRNTLYYCSSSVWTAAMSCSVSCNIQSTGTNDTCTNGGSCPSGNGRYCASDGMTLMSCSSGAYSVYSRCTNKCVVAGAGTNDYCQ